MKEPLSAYVICFALTAVCVAAQGFGTPVSDITWVVAMLSLIVVPLIMVRRIHPRDEVEAGVALTWSGRDVLAGIVVVLCILVPVVFGNHILRTEILGMDFRFDWANYGRLDTPIYQEVLIQLLCVAFPEEFFYRGYLQTAFVTHFQGRLNNKKLAPVLGIVLASACFALAHLPSGNITRLLTFFPGLLFGAIRYRSKGLLGAIICHACCNLMMIVLNVHYFQGMSE